jgi:hypothetical protein
MRYLACWACDDFCEGFIFFKFRRYANCVSISVLVWNTAICVLLQFLKLGFIHIEFWHTSS